MSVELYGESEIDPAFRKVCYTWLEKIGHAKKHKDAVFQSFADECMAFYSGPKDWSKLMGSGTGMGTDSGVPYPFFRVSVNKTFEFVSIFGPALYYENPTRTARPRMPVVIPPDFFPDPMEFQAVSMQESLRVKVDGLRGLLLQSVMNQSSNDFDLAGESRHAIDEALIKGRGCVWTELHVPPGCQYRVVRSTYATTDDLLIDPDARSMSEAKWIARRCIHPVWQVERDYGLRKGSLKGHCESQDTQAYVSNSEDGQYDRARMETSDLIIYWKIYSKMGIGGRLKGIAPGVSSPLEMFGDYCYVVVAEGVPFPLNLPPDLQNSPEFATNPQAVFGKVAWPTPFWAAGSGWPVSVLDFHRVHNSPWPMAHLRAGIGELKFLNWVTSFLMGKIKNTTRDFIALKKSVAAEIKEAILSGEDLSLLELEEGQGAIQDLVQFLQHPAVNGDVWRMIEAVEANFDKRVGLTELMYGSGGATQIRSAQEAQVRNQNMNVRPDDMARQVEAWQSEVAAKEAVALRWHIHGGDIEPVLGPVAATAWDQYVSTGDIQTAAHQLEYRVEAGSTKRPNKTADIQNKTNAFQAMAPLLQTYSQATMDMEPLNNLLADFAEANDLDPSRYQLKAPLPPPPPPPSGEPGSKEAEETAGNPPA